MNWTAIIYGIIASILALGLMYLDTKLLDNPKTKATYVKGMIMVGLITSLAVYFLEGGGFTGSGNGASMQYLPGLSEEIITGPPTF